MGFFERLKQGEAARILREQQSREEQKAQEEIRFQQETIKREHRDQRRKEAELYRTTTGVGLLVAKLGEFLATPTLSYMRAISIESGTLMEEQLFGRGYSSGPVNSDGLPISQKDPDSVFDVASWDETKNGFVRRGYQSYEKHTRKYLVVESCPNGTIIFYGDGRSGSTILTQMEWRTGISIGLSK